MPKSFRVATEGATTDGREIQREWIEQMAANYDPKKYGARVWMEHIRGLTADSVFNALGDVLSVEAREVEDGKLALFAEIDPTDELKAMNKKRQKVYSSIEVNPKFGDTGEAYLEGLAVTDSPASLGTEMIKFSREAGKGSPLASRKQHEGNLFSEAVEVVLDFSEEKPLAAEGLKAKIASLFKRHDTKTTQGFEAFRTELEGTLEVVAEHYNALADELENRPTAEQFSQLQSAHNQLNKRFEELYAQIDRTPDTPPRTPATGGGQQLTDC
ncbi:GPO family capsid scaffolding protein [Vreelandella aquamarina]|uniref:GPO family capsid scaffolding protein n=1 Tax=Vreelandella aquamarina TaxID=77097 RepID=A0A857GIR1_9GAMM|nr:GPO family capsid scaffolding protein [Halomonas meridiana]QHD49169.1 GPO family capsid scaffolding protein [Halomonas meridiana]